MIRDADKDLPILAHCPRCKSMRDHYRTSDVPPYGPYVCEVCEPEQAVAIKARRV